MQRDPAGEFLPQLTFSEDQSYGRASEQTLRDVAFHDVHEKTIQPALTRMAERQATEPSFIAVCTYTCSVSQRVQRGRGPIATRLPYPGPGSPRLLEPSHSIWSIVDGSVSTGTAQTVVSLPTTLAMVEVSPSALVESSLSAITLWFPMSGYLKYPFTPAMNDREEPSPRNKCFAPRFSTSDSVAARRNTTTIFFCPPSGTSRFSVFGPHENNTLSGTDSTMP